MMPADTPIPVKPSSPTGLLTLSDFWQLQPAERTHRLSQAILEVHTWHYARNLAYRHTLAARGVGEIASHEELPRLLRPTSQTFKSYIDLLGTPFPQECPAIFANWVADQLSVEIPRQRIDRLRSRYSSLEALLQDFETIYADFGLEISTSSGTSGRATIMLRNQTSIDKTVESFYLAFQRYLGMQVDHRAIFIMPRHTRIAMARMVGFSLRRMGIPEDRSHFTIPFTAYPDQVRIRAGLTFRRGFQGTLERLWNPLMNWMNDHYVTPRATRQTLDLLKQAEASGEKVLLFASWIHLHALALQCQSEKRVLHLAPGSLLGTGGGLKELYPFTPDQIRSDLARSMLLSDGGPLPVRDVYGMAEGNWAAMQCAQGNYHVPPWIYAVTLDTDDRFQHGPESQGMLAFFDPYGGGDLFPAFFKTADQVRLVNGAAGYDPALDCPCGEAGAYLARASIQRIDLLDEAGCAAQI
jgi:hypothetical protein